MSGMEARRVIAAVAGLAWPACRLFETITHPPWGTRLSDTLAPLMACVILALVVTSPAAHRKYASRQPRHARTSGLMMDLVLIHLHGLAARMDRCEARQERAEADQECTSARLKGALEVMNEANQAAGLPAPDVDQTMPRGLRVVRLAGRAVLPATLTPGNALRDRTGVHEHRPAFFRGEDVLGLAGFIEHAGG